MPPGSRTTVPAIAFDLHCGEVPQSNWAVTTTPTASGILVNVSATLDQHTLSEQKQLMQQACDQCITQVHLSHAPPMLWQLQLKEAIH